MSTDFRSGYVEKFRARVNGFLILRISQHYQMRLLHYVSIVRQTRYLKFEQVQHFARIINHPVHMSQIAGCSFENCPSSFFFSQKASKFFHSKIGSLYMVCGNSRYYWKPTFFYRHRMAFHCLRMAALRDATTYQAEYHTLKMTQPNLRTVYDFQVVAEHP